MGRRGFLVGPASLGEEPMIFMGFLNEIFGFWRFFFEGARSFRTSGEIRFKEREPQLGDRVGEQGVP